MDSYAAGLLVAAKLKEDGFIDDILQKRYASFDQGIGKKIEDGQFTLADLEDYSLDKTQSELMTANESGELETIKATLNNYLVKALADA